MAIDVEKEREAFELWARSQGHNLDRLQTGEYRWRTDRQAFAAWLVRAESAQADQLRPNVMRCAKCELRVNGALTSAACPNGCGPLWAVTWKEECQSVERVLESVHEEYALVRKLLVERTGEKLALAAQLESAHPAPAMPEQARAAEYVQQQYDWQRIIDGKVLCEFSDDGKEWMPRYLADVANYDGGLNFIEDANVMRKYWRFCRPSQNTESYLLQPKS